jgi:D-xylose transport system ATP-binding protein
MTTSTDPGPRKGQQDAEFVLEARGLIKRFGQVTALRGVDFTLRPGEIHALCGENGAGKSTLIKTLSGVYAHGSYEGQIVMRGEEQRFTQIKEAEAAGLSVIHQELALVPEMTVAENLFLGHEPLRLQIGNTGFVDHDRMYTEARKHLEHLEIQVPAQALVGSLGVGQKQLVEIAKALLKDSRVLILDEPSAALTEQEVEVLLKIVHDLRARGVSCVYISHKLDEVFAISDRITILRDGETIVTLDAKATNREQVIAHMVGRPLGDLFPRRKSEVGDKVLAVAELQVVEEGSDLAERPRLSGISFDLFQGEVLGIGGLMGAGRSELLMHLFGIWGQRTKGTVTLGGQPLATNPEDCIAQGLVLVTEDRKRFGLVLEQTVGFNLSLSSLKALSPSGVVNRDEEARQNQTYVTSMRIKARNQETIVGTLSGGNQQKVVLGKALMTNPKVVLLDEPTRGIDVGAKQEIYELINDLTDRGLAVLLVSSELPELMGMSDRILMLAEGRVGGSFTGAAITQEALLAAAMGQDKANASRAPGASPAHPTPPAKTTATEVAPEDK